MNDIIGTTLKHFEGKLISREGSTRFELFDLCIIFFF